MTKQVRIENADTSEWQVVVEVWQRNYNEKGEVAGENVLVESHVLGHPTQMLSTYLTSGRWLVVREQPPMKKG